MDILTDAYADFNITFITKHSFVREGFIRKKKL